MPEDHHRHDKAVSSIIIRDSDGKVFIGRRSLNCRIAPGQWETIGGKVEKGETSEDALGREIFEELGVRIAEKRYYKNFDYHGWKIELFIVRLENEPQPNPDDFAQCGWYSEDEIKEMDFAMNCKERLMEFFRDQDVGAVS